MMWIYISITYLKHKRLKLKMHLKETKKQGKNQKKTTSNIRPLHAVRMAPLQWPRRPLPCRYSPIWEFLRMRFGMSRWRLGSKVRKWVI